MSGKSYPYKPSAYKKGKTLAFFITKENDIAQDSLISKKLYENNLIAYDSTELKTVVLIYSNRLPIEELINQKNINRDINGFQICFIDVDSMCIRKVISVNPIDSFQQKRELIANTIIENFK